MNRLKYQVARVYLWLGLVMTGYALLAFKDKIQGKENGHV